MSNIFLQTFKVSRVITTKHVQPLSNDKVQKDVKSKILTPKLLISFHIHIVLNQA